MQISSSPTGQMRADASYVAQYFVSGIKPLIAFKYDDGWGIAVKHAVEKRKHLAGHRVTVSVGENRFVKSIILNAYATCQMDFFYQPGRQGIDKLNGIEAMIAGIQVEIFYVEKKPGAGFSANPAEKFRVRQPRTRPREKISDVLEEERNADPRLDRPDLCNDRLGDCFSLRQRQKIGEIAAGDSCKGEMFAIGRRFQAIDQFGNLVQIAKIDRHVSADRKADTMCRQRDGTDQVKDRGLRPFAAIEAVIHGNLEHVESTELSTRPFVNGSPVSDPDGGICLGYARR